MASVVSFRQNVFDDRVVKNTPTSIHFILG